MLEEDPDDRQLTESVLSDLGFQVPVNFVRYSHELFEFLSHSPLPTLILVDYNATPSPALDILRELKNNEAYRAIPVVVLGEGLPSHIIRKCYEAGASSYITKPSSNKATRDKIETFFRYWFDVVETG